MVKKQTKSSLGNLSGKIDKLASLVEAGFKSVDERFKKVETKMEAGFKSVDERFKKVETRMEAGFKALDSKMTAGFDRAEENRESLARIIAESFLETNGNIKKLDEKIVGLEDGQENIQLRLDSMAPQFEVSELQRRAKPLEDRAGIKHAIKN